MSYKYEQANLRMVNLPNVRIHKFTLTSDITPGKVVLNLSCSKFEFRVAF
jgi:hypothetical protein